MNGTSGIRPKMAQASFAPVAMSRRVARSIHMRTTARGWMKQTMSSRSFFIFLNLPIRKDAGSVRRRPGAGQALVEAVAVGPFQQGVEGVGVVVDAFVQVAELGEAAGHRGDGALAWLDVVDLVPGDGGGHNCFGHAAD